MAEKFGFFEATIWDDPANAELRERRHDMNILQIGDLVTVPDLRTKTVSVGTDQRHRFRRKGVPALFRMQLFHLGQPRANEPYVMDIAGGHREGATDDDGVLEESVPPSARKARITIGTDGDEEVLEIHFGGLDPIDSGTGQRQRLTNLGVYDGPLEPPGVGPHGQPIDDPGFTEAVRRFQISRGLEPSATLDEETLETLCAAHDQHGGPVAEESGQ